MVPLAKPSGGAVLPARGQLLLMMLVWVGLYLPHTSHKGPADAHDADLGGAEGQLMLTMIFDVGWYLWKKPSVGGAAPPTYLPQQPAAHDARLGRAEGQLMLTMLFCQAWYLWINHLVVGLHLSQKAS